MAQFESSIDEVLMQSPKPEHGEFIVKAKRRFEKALKIDGTTVMAKPSLRWLRNLRA